MANALEGVVILDLTQVLAGPFAVTLLADFGADVIKIENPKGSFYSKKNLFDLPEKDAARMNWNSRRNRRWITLNLRSENGKKIFLKMVEKADVVIQNFSPGTMEKLGLGYDTLSNTNPGIVYCALSGFGQTGPYKDRLAYDPIIQAASGLMSATGFPENPPVKVGISLGDYVGALYSVIGVLIALNHKRSTGEGQMIDSAMLDGLCHLTLSEVTMPLRTGLDRVGNRYPLALLDVYMTLDGKFILYSAQSDAQWESLLKLLGKEELIAEQWGPQKRNIERRDEVEDWVKQWMGSITAEQVKKGLEQARIPYSEVPRLVEMKDDPQVLDRELLVDVDDPILGKVPLVRGIVPKLLGTPGAIDTKKSITGSDKDTAEILAEFLEYSEEEISKFKDEGIHMS